LLKFSILEGQNQFKFNWSTICYFLNQMKKSFRGQTVCDFPFWRRKRFFLFKIGFVFFLLFFFSGFAQQSNGLQIRIEQISIDSTTVLSGKTARFPFPVLSVITVQDANNRYVHGLADTSRWLLPYEPTPLGPLVNDTWKTILEYHAENPNDPENPDVKATPSSFSVIETGEIENMGLSVALVMDYSGSMIDYFDEAEEAAKVFVRQMKPNDRVAVFKFSGDCYLMQDFTSDTTLLIRAIEKDSTSYSGTYLYDAIYRAITEILDEPERRIVIAYTDGRDHRKGHTLEEVIGYARTHRVPVYTIGLFGTGPQHEILQQIANETGGLYYFAPSVETLKTIYRQIYGHISGYYVLAHTSPDPFTNGKKRVLDLTLQYNGKTGRDTIHYSVPYIPPNVRASLSLETDSLSNGQWYAMAGDTVTFHLRATNTGRGPGAKVRIAFSLGDSLSFIASSPVPDSVTGDTVYWSFPRIDAKDSILIHAQAKLRDRMPFGNTEILASMHASCLEDSILSDNISQLKFYGMGFPDFTVCVKPITHIISSAYPVSVYAVITNKGNAQAESCSVSFFTDEKSIPDSTFSLPSPQAGDSVEIVFLTRFFQYGTHSIRAVVDQENRIPELNENNNTDEISVTVGVETLDVRLTGFWFDGEFRSLSGKFPSTIFARVSTQDQNHYPVHGLAHSTTWQGLGEISPTGISLSEIWHLLTETHAENPSFPESPDVRSGLQVTEVLDEPMQMGLVLDLTSDFEPWRNALRAQLPVLFSSWSQKDSGMVVGIGNPMAVLQSWTSDFNRLLHPLGSPYTGLTRRIYDGIFMALETMRNKISPKALLAVLGGEDGGSSHSLEEIIATAREYGIPIHVLECASEKHAIFDTLAQNTGGWYWHVENDSLLHSALVRIRESLRNSYVLAYSSSDTTQDQTWRRVQLGVRVLHVSDTTIGFYRAPLGKANLAVRVFAQGNFFTYSPASGDTTWFVRTGEKVRYSVALLNIGHQDLEDIQMSDVLPSTFRPDSIPFAHQFHRDSLLWTVARLPIRGKLTFSYTCIADTLFSYQNVPLGNRVYALCHEDTILYDNLASDTVLYIPLKPPDLAVSISGKGDSLVVVNGDSIWYTFAGKTVSYTITVSNLGELACQTISVTNVLPSKLHLLSLSGTEWTFRGDSLFWQIPYLGSRGGRHTVSYTCEVDTFIPPWVLPLVNQVSVYSENEISGPNNTDADTMYIAPLVPPNPEVRVFPSLIEPEDSVRIDVWTPILVHSWDIEILFENGERISDFADAFIEQTSLEPGNWLSLPISFHDTYMRTDQTEERIAVIFSTTDLWGVTRSDTAYVTIRSSDAFLLDRNVFRPENEDPLEIRFKLSSNRNVRIEIYDIAGGFVNTVAHGRFLAGWNRVHWNGRDVQDRPLGSGVYMVLIQSGNFQKALKLIVVR